MTTENLEGIVETLSNLKVKDLAKLKKMLEESWDVTAAAPTSIAVAPASVVEEKVEEATDFQVTLKEVPADKKISVIKVVREITGLGLKEAKEIAESAPKVLKERVPKAEAEEILKKIEATGAKAIMQGVS
ncbi:MAG: 50S ribosomal protein L7/L12 [Chlamydiales bacterium]